MMSRQVFGRRKAYREKLKGRKCFENNFEDDVAASGWWMAMGLYVEGKQRRGSKPIYILYVYISNYKRGRLTLIEKKRKNVDGLKKKQILR